MISINTEQKIMVYASLLNLTEPQKEFLRSAVKEEKVDWGTLLKYCTHNRVSSIVYSNLEKLGLTKNMESSINRMMNAYRERIAKRNKMLMTEVKTICKTANERSLTLVPIKGASLLPFLYKNISIREFGDIDLLIKEENIKDVIKLLQDLGYIQGDFINGNIMPASREKILNRQMLSHELYEFLKLPESNEYWDYYLVDVNTKILWQADKDFNIRYSINHTPLFDNLILQVYEDIEINTLIPEFQLMQLCAHLFSEAMHFVWDKNWRKNLTYICLYRFSDIVNLINNTTINWGMFIQYIKKNKLEEPIQYSLSAVKCLYDCTAYSFAGVDYNSKILNMYYDKNGEKLYWKRDLINRLSEPFPDRKEVMDDGSY